jgi:hypothetical protein
MLLRFLALPVIALSAMAAPAPLQVTASGTFGSDALTTLLSAPDATWQLTFTIAKNPPVFLSIPGALFDVAAADVGDVDYSLNGTEVESSLAMLEVQEGGFNFVFEEAPEHNAFGLQGTAIGGNPMDVDPSHPILYSGPESAPTILTGRWTGLSFVATIDLTTEVVSMGQLQVGTPEPASWLTLLGGLGLILGFAKRRLRG